MERASFSATFVPIAKLQSGTSHKSLILNLKNNISSRLRKVVLLLPHSAFSGCGWRRRPPDTVGKKGKVVPVLN
jgi:hypothetical protein